MKKGRPGYLDSQKKKEILKTAMMFGLVIAIMATGYLTTHTKKKFIDCRCSLGMSSGRKISCRRDHEVAVPFDRTERSRRDRTGSKDPSGCL